MLSPQVQIVTSQSMASNITSNPVNLLQYFGYSVQADYSGTSLDGTFKMQASNNHREDEQGNVLEAGTWVDVPDTSVTLSAATAGTYFKNLADVNYAYVRLVYTKDSSDVGTCSAWLCKKGY